MKKIEIDYGKFVPYIETPAIVRANGKNVNVIAVWDTGSTQTTIVADIVKELCLNPIGGIYGNTLGGQQKYQWSNVCVILGGGISVSGEMLCSDRCVSNDCKKIILGMDIISLGDFSVKPSGGKTIMTFEVP